MELGSPKKADEQVDLGVLGKEQLGRTLKFTLASTHVHICTFTYKKWNAHQVIPVLDNSVVAWFFSLKVVFMFYLKVFERMIVLSRITKPKVIVGKFQMRYKYTFCLLNIVRAEYHLPAKKKKKISFETFQQS